MQLNNKPKMQDTAGEGKKTVENIIFFSLFFFFPCYLQPLSKRFSRFKFYIKMSNEAGPGNNTFEGKGLPEADPGAFFV